MTATGGVPHPVHAALTDAVAAVLVRLATHEVRTVVVRRDVLEVLKTRTADATIHAQEQTHPGPENEQPPIAIRERPKKLSVPNNQQKWKESQLLSKGVDQDHPQSHRDLPRPLHLPPLRPHRPHLHRPPLRPVHPRPLHLQAKLQKNEANELDR